jgi:hypothetical protein
MTASISAARAKRTRRKRAFVTLDRVKLGRAAYQNLTASNLPHGIIRAQMGFRGLSNRANAGAVVMTGKSPRPNRGSERGGSHSALRIKAGTKISAPPASGKGSPSVSAQKPGGRHRLKSRPILVGRERARAGTITCSAAGIWTGYNLQGRPIGRFATRDAALNAVADDFENKGKS